MPTAEQVLAVVRREIGYRETPVNRTKYGAAYGVDGYAWCLTLCWWVMQQVPGGAGLLPRSAFTPFALDWFRGRGAVAAEPRPGDLVFFNWRTKGSRPWPQPEHVGFVEAVQRDGSLITIEGNTQPGDSGNQSSGGGVYRRARSRAYVVGFGRPAYAPAPPSDGDLFDMPLTPDDLTKIRDAVWGAPIPDYYAKPGPDGKAPSIAAFAALGWGGTHAAYARAAAEHAAGGVDGLADAVAARLAPALGQGGAVPSVGTLAELIRAALAEVGPLHLTVKETP